MINTSYRDTISNLFYPFKTAASQMEALHKASQCLNNIFKAAIEVSKDFSFAVPLGIGKLQEMIVAAGAVNTLFQPLYRAQEYCTQKDVKKTDGTSDRVLERWKKIGNNIWFGTGSAYKSKLLLTVGVSIEALRVLQANFVLPATEHLFTIAARYPVFQTAGRMINATPFGRFCSSLLTKLTGLEMLKNMFIFGSAVCNFHSNYFIRKAAQRKLEKATVGITKWQDRLNTINSIADASVQHDLLASYVNRRKKHDGDFHAVQSDVNGFLGSQIERLQVKQKVAQIDLGKANRTLVNEGCKMTVISLASAGGLGGVLDERFMKGVFNTILVATGAFGFYRAYNDVNADEQKASLKEISFNDMMARFTPKPDDVSPSTPEQPSPDAGAPEAGAPDVESTGRGSAGDYFDIPDAGEGAEAPQPTEESQQPPVGPRVLNPGSTDRELTPEELQILLSDGDQESVPQDDMEAAGRHESDVESDGVIGGSDSNANLPEAAFSSLPQQRSRPRLNADYGSDSEFDPIRKPRIFKNDV